MPVANFARDSLAVGNLTVGAACPVVFGFLTLGMHAGYAIYFPELFPTRLRGSGRGLLLQRRPDPGRSDPVPRRLDAEARLPGLTAPFTLEETASVLSLLFALGVVLLLFAPETKGQELPE